MLKRREKRLNAFGLKIVVALVTTAFLPVAHSDPLPNWNDENAAYAARGLSTSGAAPHISDGRYSNDRINTFSGLTNISNTHNDTEGDDLWTAYHMYKRLNGIHQNAANDWFTRAQNLAGFFKNSYIGGTAWSGDESYNHDHIYGWGLCEWAQGEADSTAISTIDALIAEVIAWNSNDFITDPGDSVFHVGSGGRRWARQLRLAVCAAEVSPSATNIAWRDQVIDIMLQAPEWDSTRKIYWLSSGPTNNGSRLGSGAYETGDRIAITFHMGIWMESLWQAWRVLDSEQDSRAPSLRQRIIDIATFYRDIGPNSSGAIDIHLGYNINTNAVIRDGGSGSPSFVYNLGPINGLVIAYKFTGDASYLNTAWTLYNSWQAAKAGSTGVVHHYVDSELASATGFRFLANNKGELQYVYALFENGGNPTLVGTGPVTKPLPPLLEIDPSDPATTVSINALTQTIVTGDSTTLDWSSNNSTTCDASGGWSGTRATSGSESTGALTASTLFTLTCTGTDDSASDSVMVSVTGTPGPSGAPSWYANAPDKTWINMTTAVGAYKWDGPEMHPERGSAVQSANRLTLGSGQDDHGGAVRKWNGAIAREDFYVLALAGGHTGGSGNVIYEFGPFTSETPNWHHFGLDPTKYEKPSNLGEGGISSWPGEQCKTGPGVYSDGKHVSRHSYGVGTYIPAVTGGGRQGFWPWATGVWCNVSGTFTAHSASVTFRSDADVGADYDAINTYPNVTASFVRFGGAAFDPVTEKVFTVEMSGAAQGNVWEYNPVTKTRTQIGGPNPTFGKTSGPAIDSVRRIMIVHHSQASDRLLVIDIDHDGRVGGTYGNAVEVNYTAPGILSSEKSIVFHPRSNKFVGYGGGSTIYTMTPPSNYRVGGALNSGASWGWNSVTNGSGGSTPNNAGDEGGLQSRFRYISSIDCFAVIMNSGSLNPNLSSGQRDTNVYVYKIPEGGL